MRAYLFPGQGAEIAGMGQDFYDTNPVFRNVIDQANSVLDFDLPAYLFGTAPLVAHPDWLQPATVAYQVALYRAVSVDGGPGDVLCGLSLGEYGALIASGMVTLTDGLALVAKRGAAMAQAVAQHPGKMMAIRTDDAAILSIATSVPDVWVANHNGAKQMVLGGTTAGLSLALSRLKAHNVRGLMLPVAGAFHTPLMAGAQDALEAALQMTPFNQGTVPVLSTTTIREFTPATVRTVLRSQIVSPTNFKVAAEAMVNGGIDEFIELGVKPVLTKLIKQVDGTADAHLAPTALAMEVD